MFDKASPIQKNQISQGSNMNSQSIAVIKINTYDIDKEAYKHAKE